VRDSSDAADRVLAPFSVAGRPAGLSWLRAAAAASEAGAEGVLRDFLDLAERHARRGSCASARSDAGGLKLLASVAPDGLRRSSIWSWSFVDMVGKLMNCTTCVAITFRVSRDVRGLHQE
jgi:hypothetical protein